QKRIRINTPQGKGCLFDDLQTFKFVFYNRIRIDVSRLRLEATVEIPSSQDLPNEIHKVRMFESDFCGGETRQDLVPEKVRGIMVHVREAVRQVWALDTVLQEYEPKGRLHTVYEGTIRFPVDLEWNMQIDDGFVPPGLVKRKTEARHNRILAGARPPSIAHTNGSTTVISSRKQQWGKHVLDSRTVDDTPTRRLNLGPITRLVEEFNQMRPPVQTNPAQNPAFLQTPGSLLQLQTPAHRPNADIARLVMQQTFENVCFMPQVGWCMAAEGHKQDDYIITMLFCDGCRVLVNVRDQTVRYNDGSSEYDDLPIDHSMPACVKHRLTFLPQFLASMGLGI
ncbi:hypothetical protein LPJ62_004864, partial [Coemansia sp. RSA 2167]